MNVVGTYVVLTFNSRIANVAWKDFAWRSNFCKRFWVKNLRCSFAGRKNLSNYRVFFVQLKNRLTLHCLKRLEDQTKVGDHKIGLNSNDVGQIDLNMYGATQLVRLLLALLKTSRCECMIWILNVWMITYPQLRGGGRLENLEVHIFIQGPYQIWSLLRWNRLCFFIWQNLGMNVQCTSCLPPASTSLRLPKHFEVVLF